MKRQRLSAFIWRHATAIAITLVILFLGVLGVVGYAYHVVSTRFDAARMWDLPSRIYSDGMEIIPGQSIARELLEPKLNYLGYQEVAAAPDRPGEYRYVEDGLELYLQDFTYPDLEFHGMPVRIEMGGATVRKIRRLDDDATLRGIRLEPELITSIFDEVMEDRVPVELDRVPDHLIDAIVATEDRSFFDHEGISLRGIARAAWRDLREGSLEAGGSTLTQQLVKNLFLNPERTFRRKAIEAVMAIILEARYSKSAILEAYLNEIYLGQNGSVQIVGVQRASQVYFGKNVSNLTLPESATLAGIIRSPNYYSPSRHPERATERRNVILGSMREIEMIDQTEYEKAAAAPMTRNRYPRSIRSAPFFVDLVLKELRETYPETQLKTEGLRIFTTLDTTMQRSAEKALTGGLERLVKDYAGIRKKGAPEGVVLTIQPGTGYVKALVGGSDYGKSQFNRAFQARRQPGSLFKPFVYTAAMDPSRGSEALTAAAILDDSPITVQTGGSNWKPQNYDGEFHGRISVREALVKSYNIPAVRAAIDAGVENVVQMASKIGVESRLEPYPSISLGSFEVTPLEIAYAYSVFANLGVKAEPVAILAVSTRDGRLLENRVVRMNRVAPASVSYIMNDILQDVVRYGTGARVRSLGFTRPFAGKTGTTNDYRDAWFIGYSPRILSLVWVGYDDGKNVGLSGSTAAVPIWTEHMKSIGGLIPEANWRRPDDVVDREIDPISGLLTTPYCPDQQVEVFVAGTEPSDLCPVHSGYDDPFFPWFRPDDSVDHPDDHQRPDRRRREKPNRFERFLDDLFGDDGG
ncbi:MAG TPA: PBP1A family penicillin-binding protein [Thermoanaerobaculia bacterium]|nr:PBP1A family penicillin-binding protein [Thermoanaerobaculia bacterium]